jgi:hypothetical protein
MLGRTFLTNHQIYPTRASFDNRPLYKPGGVTIDWTTVSGGSNDATVTTLADGSIINGTAKFLRYGSVITKITSTGTNKTGYFGPYDPAALDGRQTLTRGEVFIVDETTLQYASGIAGNSVVNDQVGGVFDAGTVWKDRILNSGTNTHTLALGPTLAEINSSFPAITYAEN